MLLQRKVYMFDGALQYTYTVREDHAWQKQWSGTTNQWFATGDIMLSSDYLSNGIQAPDQEQARAGIDVIPATGNGLQALNQELAGDIDIGMGG